MDGLFCGQVRKKTTGFKRSLPCWSRKPKLFLTIHPFSDGNGRTARILTNLILISLAYPPFWVTEGAEKDAYNRYLADIQAYGGSPDLCYEFLAGLVQRSVEILEMMKGRKLNGKTG